MTPLVELKEGIRKMIQNCIIELYTSEVDLDFQLERSKAEGYGDFSTTVAFSLCKSLRKPPMEIAKLLIERLKVNSNNIGFVIAAPGYINIYLSKDWKTDVLKEYAHEKQRKPIQLDKLNLDNQLKQSLNYILFRCQWILQVFNSEGINPDADSLDYSSLSNDFEKKLVDELVNLMESIGEPDIMRIQEILREFVRLFYDYNNQGQFRQMNKCEINSALSILQLITNLIE